MEEQDTHKSPVSIKKINKPRNACLKNILKVIGKHYRVPMIPTTHSYTRVLSFVMEASLFYTRPLELPRGRKRTSF